MTLKEFYNTIGSDYEAVCKRMGGSEKMLDKFVRKFPNDKTAESLFEALEAKDTELAFRMAHTLKGVCSNLGLDTLRDRSSELTEALRHQTEIPESAAPLASLVKQEYEKVMNTLNELDG